MCNMACLQKQQTSGEEECQSVRHQDTMYPTETATWSAMGIGRTLFPVQIIREQVCGEVAGMGEGGAQGTGLEPKAWRYRDLGMATEQFGRCMGMDHGWAAMRAGNKLVPDCGRS